MVLTGTLHWAPLDGVNHTRIPVGLLFLRAPMIRDSMSSFQGSVRDLLHKRIWGVTRFELHLAYTVSQNVQSNFT